MLEKLTSRATPWLDWTGRYPLTRVLLGRRWLAAYGHAGLFAAFSLLGTLIVWPVFGGDYPPGVDTPTFLHLAWVTELAASGQLSDPFQDPYWYGGFSYLVAYPPLGYGLVGTLSFISTLSVPTVHTVVLIMSYGGLGLSTTWLALEMGVGRWAALLAGILVTLAYPVLSSIFLWGWFTSIMALPLGLVAVVLLERSLRLESRKLGARPRNTVGECLGV